MQSATEGHGSLEAGQAPASAEMRVLGLGFKVLVFRVRGQGFRVLGFGFWVKVLGFRV